MRVLLISANVEKLPDPVAPLGLACLSSALKYQGHDVHCLDLCFEENIESAMEKSLSNFAPEVIGLSLRNVDNVSYPHTVSYLPFYRGLVERSRQLCQAPIFLGGSGFTLMPEAILRYLDADGGAIGEGEEAFPRALMAIAGDSTLPIHGLIRRGSGHPPRPAWIEDLDSLPPPDWSGLDLKQYFSRGGMGNLQTKRGCPFRCIYCTYPLIEGQKIRLRSPGKVAQDAEVLIRLGVANAFIVDNIFNCPESHAQEVCRTFIRKGIPLQWSCYAHPAHFSPALAANMRDAGCTGVEFGTDSGSPAVLAKRLPVTWPIHTPLLERVSRAFAARVENWEIFPPRFPILSYLRADFLKTPGEIREELSAQFCRQNRWHRVLLRMLEEGIDSFIEVGPGNVLIRMA
jgi:radical SAM superfamily enzyme YgiQ (UPF0313 family)